jgi:hypothetical protein
VYIIFVTFKIPLYTLDQFLVNLASVIQSYSELRMATYLFNVDELSMSLGQIKKIYLLKTDLVSERLSYTILQG